MLRINGTLYHVSPDGTEQLLARYGADDANAITSWIYQISFDHGNKHIHIMIKDAKGELIGEADRFPDPTPILH